MHTDHLGSTRVTSGATSSTQTYFAFGAVRTTSGTLPTEFTFTGQRRDNSTGLMYYGARYYDAALSRFIQPDTYVLARFNPHELNRYSYAQNNPVKNNDPSDHCWGLASGIRGLPTYGITCGNLDMALTILQHPNAAVIEKVAAGSYIAAEGLAPVARQSDRVDCAQVGALILPRCVRQHQKI
ncbi:MAG: RHS repeat-associated core domain-containing protein [Chloroflexi bacterium]|nr:RHS repeat-associated core domain-containing protein [Chloroflexota bacterium]